MHSGLLCARWCALSACLIHRLVEWKRGRHAALLRACSAGRENVMPLSPSPSPVLVASHAAHVLIELCSNYDNTEPKVPTFRPVGCDMRRGAGYRERVTERETKGEVTFEETGSNITSPLRPSGESKFGKLRSGFDSQIDICVALD